MIIRILFIINKIVVALHTTVNSLHLLLLAVSHQAYRPSRSNWSYWSIRRKRRDGSSRHTG